MVNRAAIFVTSTQDDLPAKTEAVTTTPLLGFFDGAIGKLYGCLHLPTAATAQPGCIVLSNAIGQEGIRLQRSLRKLARTLCKAGHYVFQFDYYGCGDSEGKCEEGRLGVWLEDVRAACKEAMLRARIEAVALIGVRLGGTLAMQISCELPSIRCVVAWDPIIDGRSYVRAMKREHARTFRMGLINPGWSFPFQRMQEASGFALSRGLINDLMQLRDLPLPKLQSDRVLLITTDEGTTCRRLVQAAACGCDWTILRCPPCAVWCKREQQPLVAANAIREISLWINRALDV